MIRFPLVEGMNPKEAADKEQREGEVGVGGGGGGSGVRG